MAKAEAKYTITAEDRTRRGVRSAERGLDRLKAGVAGFAARAAGPLAALGAAVTALGVSVNRTADRLAEMQRRGQDVGTVGGQTALLDFLSGQVGISPEQLTGGIEQLQERIQDAATGGEEARRQLHALGLTFEDLQRKSPLQQLEAIDEAIQRIADPSRRTAALSELLGGGFGRVFQGDVGRILRRGADLGIGRDATRTQAAGSAFTRARQELTATLGAQSQRAMAPVMRFLSQMLSDTATRISGGTVEGGVLTRLNQAQLAELQKMNRAQQRALGQQRGSTYEN